MTFYQFSTLFVQSSFVAFIILLLFKVRKKLGLSVLYASLGLFQFVQIFLSNNIDSNYPTNHLISQGSSIFVTVTLFALLIIYIKEDAKETKKVIYALFLVNLLITLLLQVFNWKIEDPLIDNAIANSAKPFKNSPYISTVSNIAILLDSLLLIILFEFIAKKTRFLFLQIFITMIIVVSFDTIFYATLSFWKSDKLIPVITKGLQSKGILATYFSVLFYIYLRFLDTTDRDLVFFKIKDVFQPLSYKQKFETTAIDKKKVEEKYRLLTDNSNDIICLQNVDSSFKYISPSIKKILGYDSKEFLGKKIFKYVHSDDIQKLRETIGKKLFITDYDNNAYTFRVKHKFGHYIWLEFITSAVYENNKISYFVTSARDITQRVLAKNKIESSLKLLEQKETSLNEASKLAKIGYWEYIKTSERVNWSEYIHVIYESDYKKTAPKREEIFKKFDKESQLKISKANKELDENGTPYDLELKLINNNKRVVWIRNVVQPIYDENKKIIGRRGVLQDITENKNINIKLKESEEKFFKIFKNSPNLIILNSFDEHKIVDVNDAAARISGYTPEELIGTVNIQASIWKSQRKRNIYFNRLVKNGSVKNFESEFITKSGELRIWKANAEIILIGNKKYVLSIIEDITEIRLAQNKLKAQNEFVIAMTENQNAGIVACNDKGEIVLFNKTAKEWHGVDILKIPQEKWAENYGLYKSDYKTLLKKEEIPLVQAFNGKILTNEEIVIKSVNQEPRIVLCNGASFHDNKGKKLGAVVVMNDITHQKLIEKNLRDSKDEIKKALIAAERSKFLLNESGRITRVGAWELDLITENVSWSDQIYKIHGLPIGTIPPLEKLMDYYVNGSKEVLEKAIEICIAENKSFNLELNFKNEQNELLWLNVIGYTEVNNEGKAIFVRGVLQDITEKKLTRDKIDKAEEMYRLLANNTSDLICLQEPDGTFKYISPSIENLLGYKQSEFTGKKITSIVHPDDLDSLFEAIDEVNKNLKKDAHPFRAKHKNGDYIWLEFLSTPIYENDKISYFVTTARDITQWMLANIEINEYQSSLQKLTTELTLIEEKQKKEIASNIHDHLSQSLVISKMKINELKNNKNLSEIFGDLNFIENHIVEALENSRKITFELSPPALYQLGILDTLYWFFENIENTYKVKCEINTSLDFVDLNETSSILLYRSIQEVVNNALKYAQASLITLEINKTESDFLFVVKDNGIGFDTSKLKNLKNYSGFGLFTVQERIANINGVFSITSEKNLGTTVNFFIPLTI
ncbi:PAS domain S-box protein [Polaribacter sp. KT 15]|uniref:PAS domain S-box protein n=1 Tax=Polaribacter sp. KT 15 TaxID=1896175 RepID=UPI0009095832|nr:PAS domain S-box protein [Polaribacter sp. KT 15]SHM74265.1 PAS domain S-box-containing protein [Polaribacter sp. KT 15]